LRRFTVEREEPDYLQWRKQNPLGFVLNINTWSATSPSTTNIIHDAGGCSSLNQSRTGNRERNGYERTSKAMFNGHSGAGEGNA